MVLGFFLNLGFPWGENCLRALIMCHTLHWGSRVERCLRILLFKVFDLLWSLLIIHGTCMAITWSFWEALCLKLFHNVVLLISSSPCFSCHSLCHSKYFSTYYKCYLLEKLDSSPVISFYCVAHIACVPF